MDNFLEEFKKLKEKVEALEKRTLSSLKLDSLTTRIIKPSSDSTSAIKITKADGTTVVFNIDSNNGFIGIGTDTPGQMLELRRDNASIGIRFHDPSDRWYTIGIDYNDGRKFKINEDGGFSSNNRLTISGSNIGIGTTSPATKLHLHNGRFRVSESDGSGQSGVIELSNGTKINYIFTASDGHLYLRTDDTSKHVLLQAGSSSGNVGVGTTTPGYTLDVNGQCHASSFPTSSDKRFKENVKEIDNALEKVKKLRGVYFNWNKFYQETLKVDETEDTEIGVIAQEIKEVIPEVVTTFEREVDGKKERYYSVEYARLTALLINAIKELSLKVENLEKKYGKINKR
jgi:hypothetical protein